jgi:hypothetical protein
MKKCLYLIAVLGLMLMPAALYAQPPGCTWEGDPCLRYSWNQNDGLPYHQPGPDTCTAYRGQTLDKLTVWMNRSGASNWTDASPCLLTDTLCFWAYTSIGWALAGSPPFHSCGELPPGYGYTQHILITVPCTASYAIHGPIIMHTTYCNIDIECVECGDCWDPNIRNGVPLYNADTLYVNVVFAPLHAPTILQDSITYVEQGLSSAYVTFAICNPDGCTQHPYDYNIKSKGHVGAAINTSGSVTVPGGECKNVYGILNASSALVCTYDTLTIIAWTTEGGPYYDTCVQLVHVIEAVPVPMFTVPVVTILVLALILAAAVFMRRRAISRA